MSKSEKQYQAMADTREESVLSAMIAKHEESSIGRLWRDRNRVNWSIGHKNAVVRVDRLHEDVIKKLPCNERESLIEQVFTVSIDAMAMIDGTQQRITRRIASVGFTEEDKNGARSPYLLTGSGNLSVQNGGENQGVLNDGMGFVIKAHEKATLHDDDGYFFNDPITRGVTRSPVTGQPVKLPTS